MHASQCTFVLWHDRIFTKGKDRDKMPHHATFHQGMCCMLRQNQTSQKESYYISFWGEIITCDTSIYIMHQNCIKLWGNFIVPRKSYKF